MRDDFARRLQSGTTAFVAAISAPAPDSIRARGDKRRRRQAITSAVLALAIGAGGSGAAYASFDRPGDAGQASSSAASSSGPVRPGIVAVTTKGALMVLNPVTGEATRVLVASGVAAGTVSVSPDGSTVYFAVRAGCLDKIESVPVTGGRPTAITTGVLPAVSPDGTKLAIAREPFSGGLSHTGYLSGCHLPATTGSDFKVVVRDLADGQEKVYPAPPGTASLLPFPISRLSWAPGGKLLVSIGPSQDNQGWDLAVLDPATARYYLPSGASLSGSSVPLIAGPDAAHSYYREGVFLPDGDMFVNRVCCAGVPVHTTSSLLWEISPSGQLIRQVALGFPDRDHSSLDADSTGNWLLYLSGPDLFLSRHGNAPFMLTTGLIAAAWR